MIDTVKFKIPVDEKLFKIIKQNSVETKQHDHQMGITRLHFYTSHVNIPSYFRGINIFIDEYSNDYVYIETSLPKLVWQHNLTLLNINNCKRSVNILYNHLSNYFGTFPTIDTWEITILDLCYAWKLKNHDDVISIINLLYPFITTRKKIKYIKNESVYGSSELSSFKFYNKHAEFRAHDFNDIRKSINIDVATDLLILSKEILRFEIRLRKRALQKEFNTTILSIENLFKEEVILNILQKSFTNIVDNKINFTSETDNYKKLLKMYSPVKALHLLEFYTTYYSSSLNGKAVYSVSRNRTSVYRNLKAIKKAGLGIKTDNNLNYLEFSIPSKNNINNYLEPVDLPVGKSTYSLFVGL